MMTSPTISSRKRKFDAVCVSDPTTGRDERCNDDSAANVDAKSDKITPTPVQQASKRLKQKCTDEAPVARRYEFRDLIARDKELRECYAMGESTLLINPKNRRDVTRLLSTVILREFFDLRLHLGADDLVPTIPNREQYLRWAVGLLSERERGARGVRLLDIGTGPSCIYGMLAARLYKEENGDFDGDGGDVGEGGVKVIGIDTDKKAIETAMKNVTLNQLGDTIRLIHNEKKQGRIFPVQEDIECNLSVCNPPFFDSDQLPISGGSGGEDANTEESGAKENDNDDDNESESENERDIVTAAGTKEQMETPGGELQFICQMAKESILQPSFEWFTSLIGCKSSLSTVTAFLRSREVNATRVRTVRLSPGNRTVRWGVAWTFGSHRESRAVLRPDNANASKSRAEIQLLPGRVFANQLTSVDVKGMCMMLLNDKGWEEMSGFEFEGTGALKMSNPTCNSQVLVHVNKAQDHAFVILVKAEFLGRMTHDQFQDVCRMLASDIPRALDEMSTT